MSVGSIQVGGVGSWMRGHALRLWSSPGCWGGQRPDHGMLQSPQDPWEPMADGIGVGQTSPSLVPGLPLDSLLAGLSVSPHITTHTNKQKCTCLCFVPTLPRPHRVVTQKDLAGISLASQLTSPGLRLHICKMGTTTPPSLTGCSGDSKR